MLTEQKIRMWLKRVGAIGFLFFLAKGLVWLAAAGIATLWLN